MVNMAVDLLVLKIQLKELGQKMCRLKKLSRHISHNVRDVDDVRAIINSILIVYNASNSVSRHCWALLIGTTPIKQKESCNIYFSDKKPRFDHAFFELIFLSKKRLFLAINYILTNHYSASKHNFLAIISTLSLFSVLLMKTSID